MRTVAAMSTHHKDRIARPRHLIAVELVICDCDGVIADSGGAGSH
jgi:hypothetical protein